MDDPGHPWTTLLAVDEMIIGTWYRISFLQYLPKKPVKLVIKIFE